MTRYEVLGRHGRTYRVTVDDTGRHSCSCKAYTEQAKRKTPAQITPCSHLRHFRSPITTDASNLCRALASSARTSFPLPDGHWNQLSLEPGRQAELARAIADDDVSFEGWSPAPRLLMYLEPDTPVRLYTPDGAISALQRSALGIVALATEKLPACVLDVRPLDTGFFTVHDICWCSDEISPTFTSLAERRAVLYRHLGTHDCLIPVQIARTPAEKLALVASAKQAQAAGIVLRRVNEIGATSGRLVTFGQHLVCRVAHSTHNQIITSDGLTAQSEIAFIRAGSVVEVEFTYDVDGNAVSPRVTTVLSSPRNAALPGLRRPQRIESLATKRESAEERVPLMRRYGRRGAVAPTVSVRRRKANFGAGASAVVLPPQFATTDNLSIAVADNPAIAALRKSLTEPGHQVRYQHVVTSSGVTYRSTPVFTANTATTTVAFPITYGGPVPDPPDPPAAPDPSPDDPL